MGTSMDLENLEDEPSRYLDELAENVRIALTGAGIQAFYATRPDLHGGALIEIDKVADEGAGVYIYWTLSGGLTNDVNHCLESGQYSHPLIRYSGKVRQAMQEAIVVILNAASLSARPADDDIRAYAVVVSGSREFDSVIRSLIRQASSVGSMSRRRLMRNSRAPRVG